MNTEKRPEGLFAYLLEVCIMVFKKNIFAAICLLISSALCAVKPVPLWHWESINLEDALTLPDICGVALSEYQNSGAARFPDSNWAHWEAKKTHNGHPTIKTGDDSGYACNFWETYKDDINLIKELGCNSLRLSVEWTAIEPVEGVFDEAALQHYRDVCAALIEQGIEPMITIYHWTHPQWFEDKGAFEHEENIHYFVRFCVKVFEALSPQVRLWCTINEIGSVVIQAYLRGVFPPGKTNPWTALKVMRCMMLAHCEAYRTLKKLPGGSNAQIGIVHAYVPFEPHDLGYDRPTALPEAPTKALVAPWTLLGLPRLIWAQMNLIERGGGAWMRFFFNDQMLKFLKTGSMLDWIPGLRLNVPDAPDCYDFIGLNFYARVVLESNVYGCLTGNYKQGIAFPSCREGEVMTDMQYPVCPESLYCAIQDVAQLNKPIYITENGVPDAKDDRREDFIKRYLYVLSEAIKDGYDIRGYYYWSLMDNFEWDEGYAKKFGLYEVDFVTQKRTLRNGARAYQKAVKRFMGCMDTDVIESAMPCA